ncbi:hypothetical protein HBI56_209950 [Parastagonospora nodorum]|nr:hypothetical protein HBH52_233320 [Parastagonospora nodorum]KAH3991592.1 hypothetical protein HBI10_230710 [Parastagonospora nodorum]KAH4009420.1 hypothetical protein HBI13_218310 [Parastagonospora nodorum]KAH4015103.1 hypothetical protein HBI09_206820 [Parastagonospora nodorum]KAH4044311.1 hypothetical protein HBH49_217510 [Parastagonospora nodorum]
MDDASFAYLSLLREYASRPLQGKALEYSGLYKAMVSQQAIHEERCRVSIVEFNEKGLRSITFTIYDEFKTYIDERVSKKSLRFVVLLEDLPIRLVCLLGSRLCIHPTIFARHYSTGDSSLISECIGDLPSIEQTRTKDGLEYESDDEALHEAAKKRSFTLRYPIAMPHLSATHHPDPLKCPPWLKPNKRLKDRSAYAQFVVERVLGTSSKRDKWDSRGDISELEGQVTYWFRTSPEGGYNALFLVDPCLKDPEHLALIDGNVPHATSRIIRYPELEDHQKVDISPNQCLWHPSASFTKYILHNDLLVHFSVAEACPGRNPLAITTFVRGFAVSKWIAQMNHIRRSYTHTRAALFSDELPDKLWPLCAKTPAEVVHHTAHWGANWREWIFESMVWYITDLSVYRQDVEANMRALGIDVDDLESYGFVGKREAQMWRVVHAQCTDLQDMFQQLTTLYTQVVALREAQASNMQAKSVRWLTLLGTFFVPLSVVAGIMSMGGEFLPGEPKFWVYITVVGPLLLLISLVLIVAARWGR